MELQNVNKDMYNCFVILLLWVCTQHFQLSILVCQNLTVNFVAVKIRANEICTRKRDFFLEPTRVTSFSLALMLQDLH